MSNIHNLRIKALTPLRAPEEILRALPASDDVSALIHKTRHDIEQILLEHDDRLLVIVGPCSIHDTEAALEYAKRLQVLKEAYQHELCILMRVYFEKPRTTVGWKGLINDPKLNDTFHINDGLMIARELLLHINALGLPAATEFLDTIIPQYISDLISWAAIGARTTESQIHREMSSGLSMPIGFKNGTQGNIDIAIDAIFAAKSPHHFLGVSTEGKAAIVSTLGNPSCHLILRGGKQTGPNYQEEYVKNAVKALLAKKLPEKIMIDCSHGNSEKDDEKQLEVLKNICQQILNQQPILGVMIESHLKSGNQPLTHNTPLEYGKSITDACIGWEKTEMALEQLATTVIQKRLAL